MGMIGRGLERGSENVVGHTFLEGYIWKNITECVLLSLTLTNVAYGRLRKV